MKMQNVVLNPVILFVVATLLVGLLVFVGRQHIQIVALEGEFEKVKVLVSSLPDTLKNSENYLYTKMNREGIILNKSLKSAHERVSNVEKQLQYSTTPKLIKTLESENRYLRKQLLENKQERRELQDKLDSYTAPETITYLTSDGFDLGKGIDEDDNF